MITYKGCDVKETVAGDTFAAVFSIYGYIYLADAWNF